MNEQAIQKVISEYAMENANLRIIVATLQAQLEELQQKDNTEAEGENK